MFPFWNLVVAPVLQSTGARRIVEIGALRGDNTKQMLDELGPDTELHVIDPVPDFDPEAHKQRFGGQYIFYRDLSVNVLPDLAPMDAAIIDGDHNWYTVYNECRLLAKNARDAGQPMPLMILHDVDWPYGRRDLYYDPSNIPDEFKHPHARKGIALNKVSLVPGGMNRVLHNALESGGPRNGVMTGLEDFIAEYDRPIRMVHLPLYFGLAIIAEEAQLAANPALAAEFDRLESAAGQRQLIELGERIRLKDKVWEENLGVYTTRRHDESVERYLALLKVALLGEHDADNELRLDYLIENATTTGAAPDLNILRDPSRFRVGPARMRRATLLHGQQIDPASAADDSPGDQPFHRMFPLTAMGRVRLDALHRILDELRADDIAGDLVDVAVDRGGFSAFLRGYLEAHTIDNRTVWLADSFLGSRPSTNETDQPGMAYTELGSDLNNVRDVIANLGLLDDQVRFLQGDVSQTLPPAELEHIAFLHIGPGGARDAAATLRALYNRVQPGGVVVIENQSLARHAVDAFRAEHGIDDQIIALDDFAISWRKSSAHAASPAAASFAYRPPLVPKIAPPKIALSIVVAFYRMRREAARTLRSLSRAYQRDTEGIDYEVIVVENGSPEGERLDREFVESFGPEFRFHDLAGVATSSPTTAMNHGMAQAKGDVLLLMVDGAHVVTPGVVRYVIAAQETYGPSVVAVQQWYVGPGQQPSVGARGYDQEAEDRLFDTIEWPSDGYSLFRIGHFIGNRDWFDGMGESNCVAAPRSAFEQIGGFDDSFDEPGGGFMNLDMFERLVASPDLQVVTLLGEGSFHQVHGGTTTNSFDANERGRDIARFQERYEEVRGKLFRGGGRDAHYLGSLPPAARLIRPRHRTAIAFRTARNQLEHGLPEKPSPIPQDTVAEFTDAYWHSLDWQHTTWLGETVPMAPPDLLAYQALLHHVRPSWIIDLSGQDGGRAFFFASICDLLGHGQVVSVIAPDATNRPTHDRLTTVHGTGFQPAMVDRVRDITSDTTDGFVVLGERERPGKTIKAFQAYRDFVRIGSYAVVEMTIVNGNPIWPEHGPGPTEAAVTICHENREFVADPAAERYGFTFNPGGFLKRQA